MIDPAAVGKVRGRLPAEAINSQPARWVYEAMLGLHDQGSAIDFVTVQDELERQGRLEGAGGAAYVVRLVNTVPSAFHIQSYVDIILDLAGRAGLISTLSGAGAAAYATNTPLGDAADQLRDWLHSYDAGAGATTTMSANQAVNVLWEQIDDWQQHPLRRGETRYPATGFDQLDRKLGGLRPGFHILAARPSMGKTAMALSISMNLVRRGVKVGYVTTEMQPAQLLLRLVSSVSQVSPELIERGALAPEQHQRVADALGEMADWPLDIITGVATLAGIEAYLRETQAEVVFLDFLGSIDAEGDNRHLRLGAIARSLLLISQARSLPIVALHHLRRAAENNQGKMPTMRDLYESGHLEIAADTVLLLWREGYYDKEVTHKVMKVIIAKSRLAGQLGTIDTLLTEYGLVDDIKPQIAPSWQREAYD